MPLKQGADGIKGAKLIITFLLHHVLEPPLNVVAFSHHVYQDVVLFPLALKLVGIYELGCALAIESTSLLHILLLVKICLLSSSEGCPQEIQHKNLFIFD